MGFYHWRLMISLKAAKGTPRPEAPMDLSSQSPLPSGSVFGHDFGTSVVDERAR